MSALPIRRVLTVMLAYGIGVWLLLPALDRLQRLLVLPSLFGTLVRAGLGFGALLAVAVAWRYPAVGGREEP